VILSSTNPGDVVLDPSSAPAPRARWRSGSGRHFIGVERDTTYAAGRSRPHRGGRAARPEAIGGATAEEARVARVPFLVGFGSGHVRPVKPSTTSAAATPPLFAPTER
jgi:modification methylase